MPEDHGRRGRRMSLLMIRPMVSEVPLEETGTGLLPAGQGWLVLNARDARWYYAEGRGARV